MSRMFLTAIDLNDNELQNAVVQNLAAAPASPSAGRIYYNTGDNSLYFYNGSGWQKLTTGASLSYGTITAQTSYGLSSGNGSSSDVARADHTHGTPALTTVTPSTQAIGDAASVGTGSAPAREDHKHAMPAFGAVTSQTSFGAAAANGTSANLARADHTHGTPAHDAAAHSAIKLSDLAAPTATVSMGSQIISNVAAPSASTDAANKGYVDGIAQGLDVKTSVRVATTTAGTLTSSFANGQSVDGVTLVTGDRILIKNQSAGAENGIYTVNASGAPTRATDFNSATNVTSGAFTFVESGTTNADTGWVLTTDGTITPGTTSLSFSQFSGAGTYAAGNGLSLTGTTFALNPTSTGGIAAAAGGASIKLATNSGLGTDANGLAVGAGTGITVSTGTVAVDTTKVVRKYTQTLSTSATSYTVNHALGTQDVTVAVYAAASPYAEVFCDVQHTDANNVTLLFTVAPAANAYKVVVHG